MVELRKLRHKRIKALALASFRIYALRNFYPASGGKFLDGLQKRNSLHLLDKLDCIARLATPKAMVKTFSLVYVEARSLFIVEWAAGLERRASMAHIHSV